MNEIINEKVSIMFLYDRMKGNLMPQKMRWQGKEYRFTAKSYYHRIREGRITMHIFHVTNGAMDFRLRCDGETLHWTLEEVTDGTPC